MIGNEIVWGLVSVNVAQRTQTLFHVLTLRVVKNIFTEFTTVIISS